jgi:hypothetical protein
LRRYHRRKLPAPGTKGGLFCICVESRNLTFFIFARPPARHN